MTVNIDQNYFQRLAIFLDDTLPESVLKDPNILKNIQDSLISTDVDLNINALNILRNFARKVAIRIYLESEKKINFNPSTKIITPFQKIVSRFFSCFAELCGSLFCKCETISLAIITCKELLKISNSHASEKLVRACIDKLHSQSARVPLLEIISTAEFKVPDLPVLDPNVAIVHPKLHARLLEMSSTECVNDINMVKNYISKIKQMNERKIAMELEFLEFCNFDVVFSNFDHNLIAGHPSLELRTKLLNRVIEEKTSVLPFLDSLITKLLFDPKLSKIATDLLMDNFIDILEHGVTPLQLAYLQCLPVDAASGLYKGICDVIDSADEYTMLLGWSRYLFHKDKKIKDAARAGLRAVLGFDVKCNVSYFVDMMTKKYLDFLRLPGEVVEAKEIQGFVDTIFNPVHKDFIKEVSARRLAEKLCNPYNKVRQYLPQLHQISVEKYPTLVHALSIRDGTYKFDSYEKLSMLYKNLNENTEIDLLPVIARAAFDQLLKIESDGVSLLRLPSFVNSVYEIPGQNGYYEIVLYPEIKSPVLTPVVLEWIHFNQESKKTISPENSLSILIPLVTVDNKLAKDSLVQLDTDPKAKDILLSQGKPPTILYFLLMCTQSSRFASRAATEICIELLPEAEDLGLKLLQIIVEFGGNSPIPDFIDDLIENVSTRRQALSFLVTKINFKQSIHCSFDKLNDFDIDDLPTNIVRMIATILSIQGRGSHGDKFLVSKDPVSKAFGYHCAQLNQYNSAAALSTAVREDEFLPTRAAAVEFLVEYYQNNSADNRLSLLYMDQKGENMFTLQLLNLLTVPGILENVKDYQSFIAQYLKKDVETSFVIAALHALYSREVTDKVMIEDICELINIDRYTDTVVKVVLTFPVETIRLFSENFFFYVCDIFSDDGFDFDSSLRLISELIMAKVPFPNQGMENLLEFYQKFVDNRTNNKRLCNPTYIQTVLKQIFNYSKKSKVIAIKNGYLDIVFQDIQADTDNQYLFLIYNTLSVFLYEFEDGQNALIKEWGAETIINLFKKLNINDNQYVVSFSSFLLSLVYKNENARGMFAVFNDQRKNKLGHTMFVYLICIVRETQNYAVVQLIGQLLHSQSIRIQFFKTEFLREVIDMILDGEIPERSVNEWLKVLIILTLYKDGVSKIYSSINVVEVVLWLLTIDQFRANKLFLLLLRRLVGDKRNGEGLKAGIEKICKEMSQLELYDFFLNLTGKSSDKNTYFEYDY